MTEACDTFRNTHTSQGLMVDFSTCCFSFLVHRHFHEKIQYTVTMAIHKRKFLSKKEIRNHPSPPPSINVALYIFAGRPQIYITNTRYG
jgi:hypothetical protein